MNRFTPRFDHDTIERWTGMADTFLSGRAITRQDVDVGRDAWTIAHRCGITDEAYKDRTVTDGHIQTALKRVFPNAVFKDKKVY